MMVVVPDAIQVAHGLGKLMERPAAVKGAGGRQARAGPFRRAIATRTPRR